MWRSGPSRQPQDSYARASLELAQGNLALIALRSNSLCSGQQDVAQRSPEFIPLSGWRQNKFWTPKVCNMFLTTTPKQFIDPACCRALLLSTEQYHVKLQTICPGNYHEDISTCIRCQICWNRNCLTLALQKSLRRAVGC